MSTEVWSKADLHIHSDHSDGTGSIPQIMEYVSTRTDLKVIAITDHNTIEGALFAKELEDLYGIEVVVGEEVSSKEGHVLGLFLTEEIRPGLSALETIRQITDQGGVAIIPHPFSNQGVFGLFGRTEFAEKISDLAFHALEVYNSVPYLALANRWARKLFPHGAGVAAVGGSDAHMVHSVGRGYTVFRGTSAEELRRSLDAAETYAEADRGGLALALKYMRAVPRIRQLRAANWERCRVRA